MTNQTNHAIVVCGICIPNTTIFVTTSGTTTPSFVSLTKIIE